MKLWLEALGQWCDMMCDMRDKPWRERVILCLYIYVCVCVRSCTYVQNPSKTQVKLNVWERLKDVI